jgi:hypothetical protein
VYPLRVSAPQPLTNCAHHTQTQSKPKPRRPQTASGPTRRPSPAAFDPAQLDMQQANTLLQQSLTQLYKSKHEAGDGKVVPPWDPLDVEPRWRHRTNLFDAHAPARSQVSGSRWKIGTGPETLCVSSSSFVCEACTGSYPASQSSPRAPQRPLWRGAFGRPTFVDFPSHGADSPGLYKPGTQLRSQQLLYTRRTAADGSVMRAAGHGRASVYGRSAVPRLRSQELLRRHGQEAHTMRQLSKGARWLHSSRPSSG